MKKYICIIICILILIISMISGCISNNENNNNDQDTETEGIFSDWSLIWTSNEKMKRDSGSISLSPDETKIAYSVFQKSIEILNIEKNTEKSISLPCDYYGSFAWKPDSSQLAINTGSEIEIYDTNNWEKLYSTTNEVVIDFSEWIIWSPDDSFIICMDKEYGFELFDSTTFESLKEISANHINSYATSMSFDSNYFASGAQQTQNQVWDTTTWKVIKEFGNSTGIKGGIKWSPNNNYIATIDYSIHPPASELVIWDTKSYTKIKVFEDISLANDFDWSFDGNYFGIIKDLDRLSDDSLSNIEIYRTSNWKKVSTFTPNCRIGSMDWSAKSFDLVITNVSVGVGIMDYSKIIQIWRPSITPNNV